MLKILIVEDDHSKLRHVVEVVTSVKGVSIGGIEHATTLTQAKKFLKDLRFDLMLLDLNVPNRIDAEATKSGGVALLRSISRRSGFNLPYHIIGLTAFEDAYKEALPEFSAELWDILKYDPAITDWARRLTRKIEYLVRSKRALRYGDGTSYEIDLAIITALDRVELESIKRLPANWQDLRIPNDPTFYAIGEFNSQKKKISVVTAAAPRMGMPASACLSMKLIHNFRPRYLCMSGIAAGIRGRTRLGDILVADPSYDWGSGKFEVRNGIPSFSAAQYQCRVNPTLRENLKRLAADTAFLNTIRTNWPAGANTHPLEAHVEAVASGASVLSDEAATEEIKRQHGKLYGIEMEIYGVFTAAESCAEPRPSAFAIKSVCDFGDQQKADGMQAFAAYTSSQFLYEFAIRYL